jgi:hypothetical protein
MGFFKDNTVEIEIDGVIHRVFKHEAQAIKEKLIKKGAKVRTPEKEPEKKPEQPNKQ